MSEYIRYAWGVSSLGDFLAAVSVNGLVAFGFTDSKDTALDELRAGLPGVILIEDDIALSDTLAILAHVVDHPSSAPEIRFDPRGTDYQKQVWSMLQDIPAGTTTSYGALAAKLGTNDARDVTSAIASNPIAILIPCHRVLKKDGSISGYRWGVHRKRALLQREQNVAALHQDQ